MMKDCVRAEALVERWGSGGRLGPGDLEFLEAHLGSCSACSRRHGALLPFLRREGDEGGQGEEGPEAGAAREGRGGREAGPTKEALALADSVMDAILGAEPPLRVEGKKLTPRRARLPFALGLAAAAALALALLLPRGPGGDDRVIVRFVVTEPHASSVSLAGDFTGWKTEGYAMHPDAGGRVWEIEVPLERGRVYLYNFVVDGSLWTVDPAAIEKVDDGFGGSSALLRL